MTPEGFIQKFLREEFTKRGALVRKISYEGIRGCPDLLVAYNGQIHLVEVKKAENVLPGDHQQREHVRLAKRRIKVHIIGSERQARALVALICGKD